MQRTFLGGTGTVTGSKYLVTKGGAKVLVDCGPFKGYKQIRYVTRDRHRLRRRRYRRSFSSMLTSTTPATCRFSSSTPSPARSIAVRQRMTYARSCCPTAAACGRNRVPSRSTPSHPAASQRRLLIEHFCMSRQRLSPGGAPGADAGIRGAASRLLQRKDPTNQVLDLVRILGLNDACSSSRPSSNFAVSPVVMCVSSLASPSGLPRYLIATSFHTGPTFFLSTLCQLKQLLFLANACAAMASTAAAGVARPAAAGDNGQQHWNANARNHLFLFLVICRYGDRASGRSCFGTPSTKTHVRGGPRQEDRYCCCPWRFVRIHHSCYSPH